MAGKGIRKVKNAMYATLAGLVKEGMLDKDREGNFIIRDTEWGDYSGSTYTRSNERRIVEDFPMLGLTQSMRFWPRVQGAMIPASFANDLDWSEWPDATERFASLVDVIRRLRDYPVYDESDMSEVESEIVHRAWTQWQGSDVLITVSRAIDKATADDDAWNRAAQDDLDRMDTDPGDDYSPLRKRFWALVEERNVYPVYEDAVSFHVPGDEEICRTIADEILARTRPHAPRELSFDEAEALGLDGTGRDGDPRFPYTSEA